MASRQAQAMAQSSMLTRHVARASKVLLDRPASPVMRAKRAPMAATVLMVRLEVDEDIKQRLIAGQQGRDGQVLQSAIPNEPCVICPPGVSFETSR